MLLYLDIKREYYAKLARISRWENDKKFYLTFISNNAGGEMQVQKGAKGGCKAITSHTKAT